MRAPRWVGWTLLVAGVVLLAFGWFVLGFLTEPSAVGRTRTAVEVVGAGSIAVGAVAGLIGLWMLLFRRT